MQICNFDDLIKQLHINLACFDKFVSSKNLTLSSLVEELTSKVTFAPCVMVAS